MSELQQRPGGSLAMPGKVQAIGALHLVGGLWNLALGLFWTFYGGVAGITTFGLGLVFCCPVFILFPVAYMELFSAYRHLTGARNLKPPQITSIAEICTIAVCSTFSAIPGVITLILQRDPEVLAWYEANRDP